MSNEKTAPMTVKDLVEKLKEFPPDSLVVVNSYGWSLARRVDMTGSREVTIKGDPPS